ncbi:hypothetical protein CDD81_6621 [Ophiocordyceps australis]|uniref:LEA domain-containing protein n=1 Tax=Ophiocordyceps australis TaxID=1399860 RepID=A0A2C5Y5K7_9HYPO|nr:hypothetical protein CDD81_6621 [Ophiocordyceps australis]
MSFITKKLVGAAIPASRAFSVQAPRAFGTSAVLSKSATETVKDGLKTVDRTVSDNVVLPGLDAAAKAKEKVESMTAKEAKGEVKGTAQEMKGEAKGKAEEVKGQVKGAAQEAAGKAQEVKGQAKGAAQQAAGKVKGAAEEVKQKM